MIYHIADFKRWEEALSAGLYEGDTLETEGFIHCSKKEQVLTVANNFYRGQAGLVLLCIDPDRLAAELKYEPGAHGEPELFPHVYGPLNIDAVVEVLDFPPGEDGLFVFPE